MEIGQPINNLQSRNACGNLWDSVEVFTGLKNNLVDLQVINGGNEFEVVGWKRRGMSRTFDLEGFEAHVNTIVLIRIERGIHLATQSCSLTQANREEEVQDDSLHSCSLTLSRDKAQRPE
jgi:hypothetical protein